jgi:hypothetical protein
MQVAACEYCRWIGPERRSDGRIGETVGACPHCGRQMLWITEWDAQVLGVQSAERGRLAIERVREAARAMDRPRRPSRIARLLRRRPLRP